MFNVLSYRELQTIGFKILNIDQIDFSNYTSAGCVLNAESNIGFSSFNKYMNDIALISKKNPGNLPSYIQCREHLVCSEDGSESYYTDKYVYTFKALSAQGYDSLFRMRCMKVLADREGTAIEFRLGRQYFYYDAEELSATTSAENADENTPASAKRGKTDTIPKERSMTRKELFEELYRKSAGMKRRERKEFICNEMALYFKSYELCAELVEQNLERKHRNMVCRKSPVTAEKSP